MYHQEVDFEYSDLLRLERWYNSQSSYTGTSSFGPKWTYTYGTTLDTTTKKVTSPTGKVRYYAVNGSGYLPYPGVEGNLASYNGLYNGNTSGWQETLYDGTNNYFDSSGRLTRFVTPTGDYVTIAYGPTEYTGFTVITDQFGRAIMLHHTSGILSNKIDYVIDPAGRIYNYSYTGNDLTSVQSPDGSIKTYGYQSPDILTSITLNGQSLAQWSYNNGNCTSSSIGGTNNTVTVAYNTPSTGQTTVTDSLSRQATYTYQDINGIKKTNNIAGNCGCTSASASYDNSGNMTLRRDKNGNTTTYSNYDSKGNPGTIAEASNSAAPRTKTYTHHPVTGEPTSIKWKSAIPYSNYSTTSRMFNYDGNNRIVMSYAKGNTRDVNGNNVLANYSTSYSYNSHGQVIRKTDPLGHSVAFDYYTTTISNPISYGQLKSITKYSNGVSYTTGFGNYSSGKAGWTRDANGILSRNVYDSMGRLIAVTAHTRTTRYGYDAFGNRTSMALPRGNRVGYEYDPARRLTRVRDGKGNYISYSYDTEGNRTREETHDATGVLKKYQDMAYDDDNRLRSVKGFDGYSTVNAYDGNGNILTAKDKKGGIVSYVYDALNRLMTVTQPGNIATSYTYDINDNVTSLRDGRNNTTAYVYDDQGRLMETSSPDTGLTRYEYDPAGNLIKKHDAKGTLVTYEYDALDRLKGIHYPDSTQDVAYSYDSTANGNFGTGRMTGMTDPSGTTAYYYDEYGSVLKEEKTFAGLPTQTTLYSYNDNGGLASVTYPDGRIVHYEYDDADTVTRVWTEKSGTNKNLANNITHMPYGGLSASTFGSGLTAQKGYDQDYRLTYLKSGPFMRRGYGYDPNGNITGITDLVNPARSQGFGYDALNRLTSASGAYGSLAYAYDAVGNRTQKTLGTAVTTYGYPTGNNRLSSLSGAESASYGYDANGNMTSDGTLTYTYDLNNRLITAVDTGTQTTKGIYVYDGQGRRVKKTAGGVTTYFLYDLSGRLITELDGSGNVTLNRVYSDGEPLARLNVGVQLQVKPASSSFSNKVCVNWNAVAGASYYIVCWGDTSGYYPNCSGNVSGLSYCVSNLSGLAWYFIVKAYSADGVQIGQSNEVTASLFTPNPSLPHYSYNAFIGGLTDCGICHIPAGTFMQGFGVRTSVSLCTACHNAASVGHNQPYGGKVRHPVFVDVTVDSAHRWPSIGFINGTSSDKLYTHLYKGHQVVCMTCHNSKKKPNEAGRSWEYTSTTDYKTYRLQNGGWSYYSYVRPVIYRTVNLQSPPTYMKSRKDYIVSESEYDLDPVNGAVIFHQAQGSNIYIYVTLGNNYLRNTNENNQLCLDCHITATHKDADCTVCHGTHNTDNLYNIRQKILTPKGASKGVMYSTATSMSGSTGVCVVCHTVTMYQNATSHAAMPHYDKRNCTVCHPHSKGFPSYTTVLNTLVRKVLAFAGLSNAYAAPAPLDNYSIGGGAGSLTGFAAEATVTPDTSSSAPQTVTTDVIYYYHNDHLGTPMFMTDESGNIVWRREQEPFGEDTLLRGTVTENLRMPGQYWDNEKNSSYNFYRDSYTPSLGRYGQPDPIGQAGGLNPFLYAENNPINKKDPTGEFVFALPFIYGGSSYVAELIGSAVIGGIIGYVAAKQGTCDKKPPCPKCTPYPAGTIGYIGPHTDHDHFPVGRPHLNLWKVNQNPTDCTCHWNDLKYGASPPPLPGWVNCNNGFPPLSP